MRPLAVDHILVILAKQSMCLDFDFLTGLVWNTRQHQVNYHRQKMLT